MSLEVLRSEDADWSWSFETNDDGASLGWQDVQDFDEVSITWRGREVFHRSLAEPSFNTLDELDLRYPVVEVVIMTFIERDSICCDVEIGRLAFNSQSANGQVQIANFESHGAHYRLTYKVQTLS